MRVRRRYVVHGRVQGVGFRFHTEHAALVEGLCGFVRNLDDGGVEVVAEGEAEAIERFEWQVRQGPRGARVDHVNVEDQVPTFDAVGFGIRG